jgi:CIC family chloride channel protein
MAILMIPAIIVGLGAGFGSLIFRWLIQGFSTLAFDGGARLFGFLGEYYIVLIPAIGGLFVGPIVYRFAREAKGHGVPEVMEAVALKGGRIRPVVVVIKALASSICIGSGGSAGREGPIVQIGSALGSSIGQLLRVSSDRTRMLLACGAAGGIAATFNAPVAGVLFALEVILGEFAVGHFSTVVVASVTASVVSQIFLGSQPAFSTPRYSLESAWELLFYVALGILSALVGVLFIRTLYWVEDRFDSWNIPEYIKPAIGGLAVGAIGLLAPSVFGVGYETIEAVLRNEGGPLTVVALLLVAKIAATSLTLGSGGSGGVFAPSLFMGAMLGGFFGGIVHISFPQITAPPGAYALVGMSAVFAAAARAPITAIIILFEMTGDYRIILPLMLSTVIAITLASHLESESIYTKKLSRRGIILHGGRVVDVMQSMRVEEVMTRQTKAIPLSMKRSDLIRHLQQTRRHAVPVLDEQGKLYGVVSISDLDRSREKAGQEELKAADIATRSLATVFPDEVMWSALEIMGSRDLSSLPVVDRRDPKKLLGVIRRRNIIRAYNASVLQRQDIQNRVLQARLASRSGTKFLELTVRDDSVAAGARLADLELPQSCIVVSIVRSERVLIPRGQTALQTGDTVILFVETELEGTLRQKFGDVGGR